VGDRGKLNLELKIICLINISKKVIILSTNKI